MRLYEILTEFRIEKVEISSQKPEIVVMVNPRSQQLKMFFNRSSHEHLRGLYDNNEFYFWDGSMGVHNHLADKLGIEYNWKYRLDLLKRFDPEGGDDLLVLSFDDSMFDIYKNSSYIKATFRILKDQHEYLVVK